MELDTAMTKELKENGGWVPLTPTKSVQVGNWNSSSSCLVNDHEKANQCDEKNYSAGVASNFGGVDSGNSSSSLESLGLHQTSKGVIGGISDNSAYEETAKVKMPPAWIRGIQLQNEHTDYNFGLDSTTTKASDAKKNQNPKKVSNPGFSLNKKKRPKMKRHRPKIFDESKPRKTPKSKMANPLTPKQKTPKRANPRTSPHEKMKYARKENPREVVGGSLLYAKNSCRQRVDFDLENHVRDQNEHNSYWGNEGKADSKVMGFTFQYDDNGQMQGGFQVSTNSLNVHGPEVEPISHCAAKSFMNSLNDDCASQEIANSLEGITLKAISGQTDNLNPKQCEASHKESLKLNFDLNLELQDFDSCTGIRAIIWQYQRRKKSLNSPVLKEELNAVEMINKPEAESKLQSGCTFSNMLVYKRIFRSNECLKNSRKLGPNCPKIYKKTRMKRQRATVFRNFFHMTVTDECAKKVDSCIIQEVTSNCTANRNVNKKRGSSLKLAQLTSKRRSMNYEMSSDSTVRKRNLSVILPTQTQIMEAMNDLVSFKCVWSLCPMANFRKKRSRTFGQKQKCLGAHLKETKESMKHPKPHESATTLTWLVKAKRKRSKMSTRRSDPSSFCHLPKPLLPKALSVRAQDNAQEKLEDCVEVHIEGIQHLDTQCLIETSHFEGRHLDQKDTLSSQNEAAYVKPLIFFISQKIESLHNDEGCNQLVVRDQKVHGTLLPYIGKFDPSKRRKPLPKIDLDTETMRVWKLLMENDGSEATEEVDNDKAKWWEDEREIFRGRIDSFISCMHLIQGDRRFSPWKGSVVDSVVGVFLTQNVSDHLSSSAFMSLAARFPPPSVTQQSGCYKNNASGKDAVNRNKADCGQSTDGNNEQSCFCSTEQDVIISCICVTTKSLGGDEIICEDAVLCIPDSSSHENSTTSSRPCTSENSATYREVLQVEENKFLQQFYSHEEKKLSCDESTGDTKFGDSQSMTCALSSDKTSDLDGNAASCLPQSKNLMGDLGNIKIEDSRDTGKNHESTGGRKKFLVKDKQENPVNWDDLRKTYSHSRSKDTTNGIIDSVNWEAVRQATVEEVAKVIMERGMNNKLAGRIKDFLDRMVQDHGIIDLEWLRDVPPDKAKNYLLSITGLGLKSTECVRLLTLRHHAFPVDTNVGRILVRLGWVPLLPLPEDVQIHLLNQYPLVDTIQKYIWPRLCTFAKQILYECHYQMITFGKVFCTKIRPNCNACPMRGQCKHFASAYASARLRLPGPSGKSMKSESPVTSSQDLIDTSPTLLVHYDGDFAGVGDKSYNSEPIVEFPPSPEPASGEILESDIEDFSYELEDEIPTIKLNPEELAKNILDFMEETSFLRGEGAMSKQLVALSPESASIPMPKLKSVSRLRTVHQVYELPDSHPLLAGFEKREPDDPCPYLLAIWTTDETSNSSQLPENCQQSTCDMGACCSGDTVQKQNDELIQGTILIPCRTANRGSFPLNGTYFQVNEVFADHESSRRPIGVPRKWIWNLRRRALYCGTSTTSIFRGLSTDEIQYCFWRGFICVRGMDRGSRAARPLARRFHICKTRQVDDE